jgi:hypothetical protein
MIDWKSQRQGNDSRILITMAVREMGRKSESMSSAGEDFEFGETLGDFHKEGPSLDGETD